jgi:hypothetical protein
MTKLLVQETLTEVINHDTINYMRMAQENLYARVASLGCCILKLSINRELGQQTRFPLTQAQHFCLEGSKKTARAHAWQTQQSKPKIVFRR